MSEFESKEKEKEIKLTSKEKLSKEPDNNDRQELIDDRYEIEALIGEGGMGKVYKARDTKTNTICAVKLLKKELSSDAAALKRFKQEAEAAFKLDHPNLATVFDYGETEDQTAYLVMEYVDGRDLQAILKEKGKLEPEKALSIFQQISEALTHAHTKEIIHRDIKPTNIIVQSFDSDKTLVKIVDFGIAKVMPSANRETHNLTETGEVFGSPNYMSPEQCLGFMMDARSDIYSFGCLMYETLTGNPPFSGANPIQVVMKQVNDQAPFFPALLKQNEMAKKLENVVLKCLEKDQDKRLQSISEVAGELELIQAGKEPSKFRRKVPLWKKYPPWLPQPG